jgi:hypothetical protein
LSEKAERTVVGKGASVEQEWRKPPLVQIGGALPRLAAHGVAIKVGKN